MDKLNKTAKLLFDDHAEELFVFAYNILDNEQDSRDIVQDLYVDILLKKIDLSKVKNHKSYLFVAVKNRCFKFLEKKSKTLNTDITDFEFLEKNIEDLMAKSEQSVMIHNGLQELPPKRKQIILKYINNDSTYNEIAEDLDISVNTVKMQIRLGIKHLKKSLKKIYFIFF